MATNTYVALETYTAPSAIANYTFTSIPSTYTDLVCVISTRDTTSAALGSLFAGFNGDVAATNYSYTTFIGNGSTVTSGRATNQPVMVLGQQPAALSTAGIFGVSIHHIQNYSNTSTYKTVISRSSSAANSSGEVNLYVNLWRSTAAINSLIIGSNTAFATGSTFSLYGILAEGGAKATGGYVTSDANYYYHTFLASGTFTPKSTLSCDVLVVAGGGGGGGGLGGGGGAGGYRTISSSSISSNITVTVGAGGAGGGAKPTYAAGANGSDSIFSTTTSTGGGGGNLFSDPGIAGGSGGGAAGASHLGGASSPVTSPVQGFKGGDTSISGATAGGGGAGAAGTNGTVVNTGQPGGIGSFTAISGGATTNAGVLSGGNYYFAGGGGGGGNGTGAAGGLGGGGAGSNSFLVVGTSGTANTGGGGGGSSYNNSSPNQWPGGGSGGSGIVIVRYAK